MKQETHASTTDCIFCKMVAGLTTCHTVWESYQHLAFLSIFPNTEGFTVVIPKHHLSSYIFDHTSDEINGLMEAARKVSQLLVHKFPTVARTAVVFEGYGVDHLHAKLIPLHGTKREHWVKTSASIQTKFDQYPGYISSHDAERASDEKLAALASLLRS
ncbi:MAG: HIT family protein [Candidatus Cardinium sp.]|nr:HIT family protein [Candidatus Cardinium sp.]